MSGTAYADTVSGASSKVTGELCNNGLPPPSNALICSEDFLGGGVSLANGLHDFLNMPGIDVLTVIAKGWKDSFGLLFNFAGGVLGSVFSALTYPANKACGLPGAAQGPFLPYCSVKGVAEDEIPKIVEGVTKWLVPDPFGVPMGGGRQFVLGAGGADYLGNDSAHRVLGAQAISAGQKAKILNAYTQEEKTQFSNQSFFARMFNGDSQYSLVSKLAMDVPLGSPGGTVQQSFASLLNPFGALGHGFGSIFSGRASADVAAQDDPFGITQYGYPSGSIPGDPEEYWNSHCSDNADNAYQKDNSWNKAASGSANADPNTGEPLNKTTNPCLLIMATVGADGGLFDTSNLTKDDLADLNDGGNLGSTPVTTSAGGFTNPFPDGWTPGRLDMGYDGTFKNKIVSPCDGTVAYVNADTDHSYNGGWNGAWFAIKCAQSIPGFDSNIFYFTEGVSPTVTQGKTVSAGQQIGKPGWTGYSEGPGGIEWGLADPDGLSSELTLAYKLGAHRCPDSTPQSRAMVLKFSGWVQSNLHVKPPSSTSDAGCA